MTFRFCKNVSLAFLTTFAFGTGCSTCDSKKEDAGSLVVSSRPLSFSDALSKEQIDQAKGWAEFAQGIALKEQGKNGDKAAEHFAKALVFLPESETVVRELIGPRLVAKELEKALNDISGVLKQRPSSVVCNLIYAELLDLLKRDKEAFAHLEKVFNSSNPKELKYARSLIPFYVKSKRYAEAEELFNLLLSDSDYNKNCSVIVGNIVFWNSLADVIEKPLEEEGKDKKNKSDKVEKIHYSAKECRAKALKSAQMLCSLDFESIDDATLAYEVLDQNKYHDLLAVLLEKLEKNEKFTDTVGLCILKMEILGKQEDKKAYMKYLDDLYSTQTLHPAVLEKLTETLIGQKKFKQALEVCMRLFLNNPNNLGIRIRLAQLYWINNDPDKGLELLLPLKNIPPYAHYLMSSLWRAKNNYERAYEAISAAEAAAKREKMEEMIDIQFLYSFSIICEKCNKIDEALDKARQAYEKDKDNPSNCNFYGYMLADHNRKLDLAKSLIQQALDKEPENSAYLDSMAWTCFRLKQYPDALKYILLALSNNGLEDDPEGVIADHAGDICLAMGLNSLARHFWVIASQAEGTAAKGAREKLDKYNKPKKQLSNFQPVQGR